MPLTDHPHRYAMANELHARPFPKIGCPGSVAYLALKPASNAAARDAAADRAHLIDLLDRYGAPHPQPDATHYSGKIGRCFLKWESHTEFVTYTVHGLPLSDQPFDAASFALFPDDWLDKAPGTRVTSAIIRIEPIPEAGIPERLQDWFVAESIAVSRMLDGQVICAGDFRVDERGHMRFAAFVEPGTGQQRIGRVIQRLCEIETYKAMAMLGFLRTRALNAQMGEVDARLSALMADMSAGAPERTLQGLLDISEELEKLIAQSAFRFGATGAYETIVNQRIDVLRETRFDGRQTFAEFMLRRFDPAMRTVKSTERRLQTMSERAARAGELLRTRVDVERSAQNQALLESMDRRADLQLRLQQTVEGLSVVAISYYALNLLAYFLAPAAKLAGVDKPWLTAALVPVVMLLVWGAIRRIHRKLH